MKTISASVLGMLALEAERRGLDAASLLKEERWPAETLAEPEGRIPLVAADRLLQRLENAFDGSSFPLEAVRHFAVAGRGCFHYLTANACDVHDYLELTMRFSRLISDGTLLRTRYEHYVVEIEHVLVEPATRPQVALQVSRVAWMAAFVHRVRAFTHAVFEPDEISIAAPAPRPARSLADMFGIEPRFGQASTSIRFSPESLSIPFVNADPSLRAVMYERAQAMLDALPPIADMHLTVKATVRSCVCAGDASLASVSRALGMAPRTLQDRLHGAGVSFRRIVDESRLELALERLQAQDARVADVAYSLGFESPSAFTRWYRRRTGRPPGMQRRTA